MDKIMRYQKLLTLFMLLTLFSGNLPATGFNASLRVGNVSQSSIAKAIAEAKVIFQANPRQTVVIDLPVGNFDLSKDIKGHGTIDVSGVQPAPGGWLIFRGAGAAKTILTFNRDVTWIYGMQTNRVVFQNMQMTGHRPAVSQGYVVSVGLGRVVLDIPSGFPSPGEIYNPGRISGGRWLRQYTNSKTDPRMIEDPVIPMNRQVGWDSTTQIAGGRWQMNLTKPNLVAPYHPGDLIGITSKQTGNNYYFFQSSDIIFDHVQWKVKSRGVFCGGTSRVTFSNCRIDRSEPINGQTQCLSTPDGGPQLGQPEDLPSTGHRVENCVFVATGDDSVAFFKASGSITNTRIRDSFGRGIVLYQSPNVTLTNNEVVRCPILNFL